MSKHLNPLEKEFLIRRYRSNQRISIKDFCKNNGITEPSLKKWMKQYDEGGLEGLARADAQSKEVLPRRRRPHGRVLQARDPQTPNRA